MASYDIGRLVWKVEGDTTGIDQSLKKTETGFGKLTGAVKGFIGLGIVTTLFSLGKAVLSASAAMEKSKVAFTTMLGSADKANQLLKEMTTFAAKTPFELPEIVNAGKQLLAFGVASDNIIPTLRRLGDVSAALNIPIGELSDLYGKARVQGTLYAEDLNQLAGRGIPIFTELAKVMGVNASEVKKLGSEGKISFALMEKAFINMTAKGSQFGGLMEEQAKTLGGQWSNLQDSLGQIAVIIGDDISPAAKEWLSLFNNILGAIVSQKSSTSEISSIMLKVLSPAKGLFDYATWTAEAINKQVEKWTAAEKAVQSYQDTIESGRLPVQKAVETSGGGKKTSSGESEATKLRRDTFEKNVAFEQLESEKIAQELESRQALYKKLGLNKQSDIDALREYEINAQKKITEAEQKELSERIGFYNNYAQQIGSQVTGLLSAFQGLYAARAQADIDALDAQMEAELEAAGVSEDTQVEQAQKEYDAAVATGDALAIEEKKRLLTKAQIEDKYRKEKAQREYELALEGWKFQRAIAALQIPLAIMSAIASGSQAPWPTTPFFMAAYGALAGVTAGAQFAAVEASKPQPPKFASGGIIPGSAQGTQIIAGENNSTELVMNADQMANTLSAIGNGGSSGGGHRQVPPMSEEGLFKMIFNASQNGDLFIAERAITNR